MRDIGLRHRLFVLLEPQAWPHKGLSPLNKFITALICFAALIAILESEASVLQENTHLFLGVEAVLTIIFTAEYGARIWVAGEQEKYRGLIGRLRYMASPSALIDLMALLPLLLGLLGSQAFLLRLFRLFRVLRLAKLGRFSRATTAIIEALHVRRYELLMSVVVAAVLLLFSSTLLYIVEGDSQQDAFGSIPRAMWWSIATLTTVGYGDIVPVTALGRALAGFTALLGIGLIAMPTGILASAFSDAIQRQRQSEQSTEDGKSD
ncbi:potassium transporter Kef [Pelagibacterium lentulum]|uniref:Potassium transporter Kef n=2 Tax=Pelagibacterium lentulum TaxID=2029865 RepID=A0A916RCG6_9HYPH|nr:potassium transporter Kef [Pelagibacterium lentulum]